MDISLEGKGASGPLTGIRVLDLSAVVSGPLCSQILGDLGADVLKVEAPGGDATRRLGMPDECGFTGWFLNFNRNKRGVCVDLKTAEGVQVVQRLARDADVVIENYRPEVAERLGVGYETLSAENEGLVFVSITGFGPDGPYRDRPAYDSVIQGYGGFMPTQGGEGEPALVRSIAADKISALTATYAVLAALFAREKNAGKGQRIDIPMLDSWVAYILPDVFLDRAYADKPEPGPMPNIHRTWATADGHVVMMLIEDHQFHSMCRTVDREDLIDDPRCRTIIDRFMNAATLFPEVEAELRKWKTQELVDRAAKFGAPLAPANGIPELMADPQAKHAKILVDVEHEKAGTLRYLRSPARFSSTPTSFHAHPPALGEHNEQVLREAGYSDEEIEALRAAGAIVGAG